RFCRSCVFGTLHNDPGVMKLRKKRKRSRRSSARARGGHSAARFSAIFFAASFVMITDVLGAVAQPATGQLNAAEKLVAERMKVGGAAFFRQTVFEGRVDFGFADIASSFETDEAQFNDKENEANFAAMKVGGLAFFRRAVFEGPANFGSARIEMNFEANEVRF